MKNKLKKVFFPYVLEWRITDACNMDCLYCTSHKNTKLEDTDYSATLNRIGEISPKHIWIGGGEPTIIPEFPDIVKSLKNKTNAHIVINTNLVRARSVKSVLPFINDIVVSLDTYDRAVSMKYRKVDPEDIIKSLKCISELNKKENYGVNISVNSVVYRSTVLTEGINKLNDRLFTIDPGIFHILCPLYPADREESIILDNNSKEKFFEIVKKLRKKKRKIHIDFPEFEEYVEVLPVKCFRRFFRLQLVGTGEIFSPCPPAAPKSPWCPAPCNAACFIEDLIAPKGAKDFLASPMRGRLSVNEKNELKKFIKRYINPDINEDLFNYL